MRYTTRAFKILLSEAIERFEKDYPDETLQGKADVYKSNLRQCISRTNASALLRAKIETEINKMPYYFSKIGYLVKNLSDILKDNPIKDCMETDEHEKNELESQSQSTRQNKPSAEVEEQLEKEQAKNKIYYTVVEQLKTEKDDLSSKLQEEIQKSQKYQIQLQDLLSKITEIKQNDSKVTIDDLNLIEELQAFNKELIEENIKLSSENKAISEKYAEMVALNRKLKSKCDALEDKYKDLTQKLTQQTQLINAQIQQETSKLRQEFDTRVKQLEAKQQATVSGRSLRYGYFNRTKRADEPDKQVKPGNVITKNRKAIFPENFSL